MNSNKDVVSERITNLNMAIQYRLIDMKVNGSNEGAVDCLVEDYRELTKVLELIGIVA